jgi:hypothetical protein
MGARRTKTNRIRTNQYKLGAVYRRNTQNQTTPNKLPDTATKRKHPHLKLETDAEVYYEPKQPKNQQPEK